MPRGTDIGHIQKQCLSLLVILLKSNMAGKDTFRGYLMGLGSQGKESLF
jgi:hypothetical protein